ncbi:P-loop containing nucleoside triphosphate hydrolase protein [Multifurca ochricompacta]|uniref:P-loop containing nucleoside triphosphate hydrolase protein n=1 Tax=Multifurca ochricompacta TaxID=376703 RepID=A0AAD4QRZ4_9AGAM|nr:P-loop containing nucleoside triphosphate hydrolase protein [Multifurca ochricompacta]
MFSIASDSAKSVRYVLEHDHADPNESIGPQSALAFALTNEHLTQKLEIVKALLAHGADPASLRNPELNPPHRDSSVGDDSMLLSPPPTTTLEAMDPATRYFISRADAPQTRHLSTLLQKSLFRPLGGVRYDIVGQDQVFEQLFTVLNLHSRTLSVSPLVILLCGPSGHGKSFLARRFGPLLGVPTHTVNVTTLRSTHDLWDSYSMSPYEEITTRTLAQFLLENEGKRCVVVLDEIEKVEEPKVLYSLLMPWELGERVAGTCSPRAGHRHIDVRQVVWLGTSNIGHDFVFEFCETSSGMSVSHGEYLELARLVRPRVSQSLGASLSSRVTTVLPFVPFTEAELMAIATEAFYSLGGERAYFVSLDIVEHVSRKAIECYIPEEGARSLHRAISSLLMDMPEFLEQSNK